MPRKKREWYPGAQYHIMCRGNHRADIYRDDEDRHVYLTILEEERYKHNLIIISYCLMSNHVHLEVEVVDKGPGMFMKMLNMKYAIFFNKKYNYVGHLFQGRYRSELIATDAQLLQTSKYIHLNPVRANMVEKPEQYAWSSYREYLCQLPRISSEEQEEQKTLTTPSLGVATVTLAPEIILKYFKDNNAALYKEYVEFDLHLHAASFDPNNPVSDPAIDLSNDMLNDLLNDPLKDTLTDELTDPLKDTLTEQLTDPLKSQLTDPTKNPSTDSAHGDDVNDLKQPGKPGEEY